MLSCLSSAVDTFLIASFSSVLIPWRNTFWTPIPTRKLLGDYLVISLTEWPAKLACVSFYDKKEKKIHPAFTTNHNVLHVVNPHSRYGFWSSLSSAFCYYYFLNIRNTGLVMIFKVIKTVCSIFRKQSVYSELCSMPGVMMLQFWQGPVDTILLKN